MSVSLAHVSLFRSNIQAASSESSGQVSFGSVPTDTSSESGTWSPSASGPTGSGSHASSRPSPSKSGLSGSHTARSSYIMTEQPTKLPSSSYSGSESGGQEVSLVGASAGSSRGRAGVSATKKDT